MLLLLPAIQPLQKATSAPVTLSLFMMSLLPHIPIVALSPAPFSRSLSTSFLICFLKTAVEAFQIAQQHSAEIWPSPRTVACQFSHLIRVPRSPNGRPEVDVSPMIGLYACEKHEIRRYRPSAARTPHPRDRVARRPAPLPRPTVRRPPKSLFSADQEGGAKNGAENGPDWPRWTKYKLRN
jgi:hypothetical protein